MSKIYLKKYVIIALCIVLSQKTFAQAINADSTIILDSSKTLQTDVFILRTCEPNQLSIVKMYDDYRQVRKVEARKLEISTNHFSSFKITDINPLRYNYYINDELVTQFVEDKAFNEPNNIFSIGSILPVKEIETVKIFNIDWEHITDNKKLISDQKQKLIDFLASINTGKEALDKAYSDLYEIADFDVDNSEWEPINPNLKDAASELKKRRSDVVDKQNNLITLSLQTWQAFKIYDDKISNLPISSNNNLFNGYVCDKYKGNLNGTDNKIDTIIDQINLFNSKYDKLNEDFSSISQLLNNMYSIISNQQENLNSYALVEKSDYNKYQTRPAEIASQITKILSNYNYAVDWDGTKDAYTSYFQDDALLDYKTYFAAYIIFATDIKQFMFNKRYQLYEEFLLNSSASIGKLLQSKYVNYSQDLNSFYHQNCLPQPKLIQADSIKSDITRGFNFIQDLTSDIAVAVGYLEINNREFKDIVTNVNLYFTGLLKFLKYLDHIEKNNTVEFTLPTHNNLKNVDLIRYKIDREDQLTKSKQTYNYDIWLKGGLKVDFSVGIFATQLKDYEYEKTQAYKYDDPTILLGDSIYINRKEKGKFDFAFGGMVNISYRNGANWITPGISLGVAYSDNQQLQFLSSLSLHLGKTERLILHGGFAAGPSKTLDLSNLLYNTTLDNNHGNKFQVKGNFTDFNIVTIDKFSFRPFFGISYNLSRKNALQAVSGKGVEKFNSSQNTSGSVPQ